MTKKSVVLIKHETLLCALWYNIPQKLDKFQHWPTFGPQVVQLNILYINMGRIVPAVTNIAQYPDNAQMR